jgi:acetyl-CoA carboxylase alpha subunit
MAKTLKATLLNYLTELQSYSTTKLLNERYKRLMAYGLTP